MSVKERLKIFLKQQGIAVSEFEKSINASNGYVNSISKNIGFDKLNLFIEKYSNINLEWLVTGKGEMLKNENISKQIVQVEKTESNDTDWEREYYKVLKELNECLKKNNELLTDKSSHRAS